MALGPRREGQAARARARVAMAFLAFLHLPASAQEAAPDGPARPATLFDDAEVGTLAGAPNGAEAFARADYGEAARRWREEAAEGSGEAALGLGLIHDLGLGVPRSTATALRWYLEAAGRGVADAQFNVGVMLDAGAGAPRDVAAAATWYARAAANGKARAKYNLALLYEEGSGVPRNPALARALHEAAGDAVTAAVTRLAGLPPSTETAVVAPPRPVTGEIVGPPEAPRAELVWTAAEGAGPFFVEVARRPPDGAAGADAGDLVGARVVDEPLVALPLLAGEEDLIWRVGRSVAGGDLGWSSWQRLPPRGAAAGAGPTDEQLVILVNPGDRAAGVFAEELQAVFGADGLAVTIREAAEPAPSTAVEYRRPADAGLARAVAEFLPALDREAPMLAPEPATDAAAVTLRLVGGPDPAGG